MSVELHVTQHGSPKAYAGGELETLRCASNYYDWILNYFRPWLNGTVVEIGAGIGTFSHQLRRVITVERLILVEPATHLASALMERYEYDDSVDVRAGYFQGCDDEQCVNAVVLVNVLEHIENDAMMLSSIYNTLCPGGVVLLFVPSLTCLYGSLDAEFGHFRRYTASELTRSLQAAGFQITTHRYMNLPGAFAWFVLSRILRMRTLRRSHVSLYDRFAIPWVSRLEKWLAPPFGQSLLAVAKKPNAT